MQTAKRVLNLRAKIAKRREELGIIPVFDKRGHHYILPGNEEFNSVTQKLQTVKDPGLMNWRRDRSLGYLTDVLMTMFKNQASFAHDYDILKEIDIAREAPVREFEGAGNIGTAVHAWREAWFNNWIVTGEKNAPVNFPDPTSYLVNQYAQNSYTASTEAIKRCINDLKAEPLAVELPLVDVGTKTGGTGDDIWAVPIFEKVEYPAVEGDPLSGGYKIKVRWEIWFVDLKTSNIGNKDSYMLQVATYVHMFEKLYGIKIDKTFILHTSKEKFGQYELIPVKEPKRLWQIAKVAFKLSDMLEEIKEIKKLKGVTI